MEVLIGVAVMMPMTLAAAMGLMTAVSASANARTAQELQIALTTATENVKAMPYVECADAEQYQKLYSTWVQPLAAKVVDGVQTTEPEVLAVAHWQREKGVYTDSCSEDDGAQRVEVSVSVGDQSASGTVVKRNDAASVRGSG
jgi:ABC-type phosphate transport system substrate-binding protein